MIQEKLGCKPVHEVLDKWVEKQEIESIKCMFSKYMVITNSL